MPNRYWALIRSHFCALLNSLSTFLLLSVLYTDPGPRQDVDPQRRNQLQGHLSRPDSPPAGQRQSSIAKFLVPDWGDKVDYGIGSIYRPANPCIAWRAGTITQCNCRLYPPGQGLRIRSQVTQDSCNQDWCQPHPAESGYIPVFCLIRIRTVGICWLKISFYFQKPRIPQKLKQTLNSFLGWLFLPLPGPGSADPNESVSGFPK